MEHDAVDVSVVVPVYNVERYLGQCLASLAAQTIESAEFICLNDGSTDGSKAILDEFAARDARFTVVDKPNSGYGATMNEGLRRARGRYVGVVESDDWVEPDCFKRLFHLARDHGFCDIVKANHFTFNDARERFVENFREELCGYVIEPRGAGYDPLIMSTPAIWTAVYRRGFLAENAIGFLETPGASYQDTGFVFKSWAAARTVLLVHDAFIHYRTGREGASSVASDKVFQVCAEFDSIDEFARGLPGCDPHLPAALAAKRFDTYLWNLKRLGWSDKRAFIARTAPELRAIGREVGWDDAPLAAKHRKALRRWMNDPEGYYLDLRIRDARKQGSPAAYPLRLRRKLHNLARKR